MRFLFLTLVTLLVCTSAHSQQRDDAYFDAIATDICNCTSEMLDLNDKMQKLAEKGDRDGLAKLSEKAEAGVSKMENCIDALEQKYPDIDGNREFEKKAEAALAKICPRFFAVMGNAQMDYEEIEEYEEVDVIVEDGSVDGVEEMEEIEEMEEVESIIETEEPLVETKTLDDAYFLEAAKGFCACTGRVFELGREITKLTTEEKSDEAKALETEYLKALEEMEPCVDKLMQKFPLLESSEENKKRATDALVKTCPENFSQAE